MVQNIEFKNISKTFVTVRALRDVSFVANAGEVCAVVGENGAGKSTLLKILSGDLQPDKGSLFIDGEEKQFRSPQEAIASGISVIYQERQVMPYLTVAENIFMEDLPVKKNRLIDFKKLYTNTQKILDEFNLPIKPTDRVRDLSVAYQQMVEIMKAYRRNSEIIAFDEPTSSLSEAEIDMLFKVIERLKEERKVILYVSHRLKEIFHISETVVVLKDGRFVTKLRTAETDEQQLVKHMIGRDLGDVFNTLNREKSIGKVILDVKGLTTDRISDVSFKLHRGEILGFAGLVGAGRTETMKAIFGADAVHSGEIWVEGKRVNIKSPADAIAEGIGFCSEDRIAEGIFRVRPVKENMSVVILEQLVRNGFIDFKREARIAKDQVTALQIKTPSVMTKIIELSGGNQQKVLLARWLTSNPKILILDEPTRGIDVGAKAEIYRLIVDLANSGLGIIFISSELPEIIGLSDNIVVMREGRISGFLTREEATEEDILTLAMKSKE
ncbi:MAG: sugar ABC transporter ATP-binding protein [Dethiobacteria bacterium]|jgi:L-arabinose transport system ATP-binding protein|nr:sugar ABC transporter ATP-binding protein [Bacillota bacterium]HOJ83314.1 sugar ABC transporter ATP-binding protein [Bacillota bacterium]HQE10575.1 sugar ABC transporter ATP-binding protein [Bacillota bacterium]